MNCKHSEIFKSFQGEGLYTGVPTVWLRVFSCNLQCKGFSQPDPTDESTYINPLATVDLSKITKFQDLPVVEYGCDSIYSHDKRFAKRAPVDTTENLATNLINLNRSDTNPDGLWVNPNTKESTHLAFTGGEPLMSQRQIIDVLCHMEDKYTLPTYVTFETNGTKELLPELVEWFNKHEDIEVFFSISPKLHTVSGELPDKAWKPEVFSTYTQLINNSLAQVKFVVRDAEESRNELLLRASEIYNGNWYFYAMPVGSTKEQQENINVDFVMWLMNNGFRISGRLHSLMLGNAIGL